MSTVTEPLRRHVGRKIREARTSAGLSQKQLAERIGTGPDGRLYLIRLEQGKHLPRESTLAAIARATGRDVEWFLPDEEREAA